MRIFPLVPKSVRTLEPGDYWGVRLSEGRFGLGRVLQIEGDELPTKTRSFFGGLHDWIGDRPPAERDVLDSPLTRYGVMHVMAIRETGGHILGNVPLSTNLDEIPTLMDCRGGPGARILKGVQTVRAAEPSEWGKVETLRMWGYDVIRLLAEQRATQ